MWWRVNFTSYVYVHFLLLCPQFSMWVSFFFKKKGAVQLRWIDLQNSVHVIVVESLFHTCEWFYYLMKKNHVSMTTFVSSNLSIKTAVLITKGQTRKKVPWLDISDSPYSGPSWECLERQRKQQLNRPETLLGQ